MNPFDLVIRSGTLVAAGETFRADLAVLDGRIAAIGEGLEGRENIDADGLLVLPGAVDAHVHLEMPVGQTASSDDFESGSIAAAYGGTTTIIDFVEPAAHQTLLQALQERRAQAEGRAVIDFGMHMTLCNAREETLAQVAQVVAAGVRSFKTYLTYEGFILDDSEFLRALKAVRDAGGVTLVHAENHAMIEWLKRQHEQAGHTQPRYHAESRPVSSEVEAITRALAMAEAVDASLYVVHISTAGGAQAVRQARKRGVRAFGETCPQYLVLDEREYGRPGFEAAKYVCSPPLRNVENQTPLWQALAGNDLQTVATDHCPFFFKGQKDLGIDTFLKIPGGLPGVEARLALVYSFGVGRGLLSLNRWVEVCCTNPARLFGLHPRKGTLMPGSDADIVLFDPEKQLQLTHATLHEHTDYTPYEGMQLCGWPVKTFKAGRLLCEDGNFVGGKGGGKFLPG